MNVGEVCRSRVVSLPQTASLAEVARRMTDEHVGAIIVTDDNSEHARLVGIITDRDIVTAQLQQARDLASLNVGATMTRDVLTLLENEPLDGAIAHMRAKKVRRAPVVSPEGVPIGLVSVDDLIAQLSLKLVGIAGIVAQQSRREH
jgi:CBS domain-containing protein